MIYHHVTHWSKSRPVCHVMSARIAGRVGLVSCSHVSEMATVCKIKRSSYDAAFQLRVIESTENLHNYANLPVYYGLLFVFRTLKCRKTKCTILLPVILPTTYTRVNDFGQHMDSIFFLGGGDLYMGVSCRRVHTVYR